MFIEIIILVNLLLYFKTLRYKFVSDDFAVYKNPPAFKNEWHKRWLQFIGACKLMEQSVHFIKHEGRWKIIFAKTEEFEHLYALVIHIAICLAIYFAFGKSYISFIAALLYSVNPVNNQGTIWPGGRGYALPILSLLVSVGMPILAPVMLYFCSSFTVGFLAPLVLIGSKQWYLLGLMPIIWWFHSKKFRTAIKSKASKEVFDEDRKIHPRKLIILIKTYGFYFILCLFPFRITFYHNFLQSMAGNDIMKARVYKLDRYFFTGLIAGFGTLIYSYLHWGPLAWALLAFMIGIAPFCNLMRNNQEIAERFAALPNVFLMYALAQIIAPYNFIITAFLAFYATRTYYTLSLYRDEYFITECAIIEDPRAWWAWHCRAMKRWDTQSYKEALILWTMAKLISPKEFKVLMNIATCLRLLKNDQEADHFLKLAEENIVKGQEKEANRFIAEHRKGKLPILL